MRSSPRFLVVSRSKDPVENLPHSNNFRDVEDDPLDRNGDPLSGDGLHIDLHVSYKTLLLIFMLFNLLQRILTGFIDPEGYLHLWK